MNETTNKRPNIIVILADDMGYSDIGCFGSEIKTPSLDSMANDGVRFTQMYNCARCCPTRASLLTGLYPQQAGVGHMVGDRGIGPAYQGYLRDDCVTIAEVLKTAGYQTLYSGKWHASPGVRIVGNTAPEPGAPGNPVPWTRGFDRFYGTLSGCGNFFNPHSLFDHDKPIQADDPDYYYTDVISDKAINMIEDASEADAPFFMHVCYTAPHWPLHARPEDIEKYRGLYGKGWDYYRTGRHEQLKGSGILDSSWDISPRDSEAPGFDSFDPQRREWEDLRMAVYAAQVESMDRGIGRIVETLKAQNIDDNTIVMFLSDNGGCAEFLNEDGDEMGWPGMYTHSARPGETCTVGNIQSMEPGPATTFMSYDLPWANVSNTPFRLYKHWVHEGGIATPLVVQWPKGAKPGHITHEPCHVIDIMATCLDAAGAAYPNTYNGNEITPLEGESFLPLIKGGSQPRLHPIGWEHECNMAMRDKEWKLVRKNPHAWELYNMQEDRTELNDLTQSNQPQLKRMLDMYNEWADRVGVIDWKNNK